MRLDVTSDEGSGVSFRSYPRICAIRSSVGSTCPAVYKRDLPSPPFPILFFFPHPPSSISATSIHCWNTYRKTNWLLHWITPWKQTRIQTTIQCLPQWSFWNYLTRCPSHLWSLMCLQPRHLWLHLTRKPQALCLIRLSVETDRFRLWNSTRVLMG